MLLNQDIKIIIICCYYDFRMNKLRICFICRPYHQRCCKAYGRKLYMAPLFVRRYNIPMVHFFQYFADFSIEKNVLVMFMNFFAYYYNINSKEVYMYVRMFEWSR